MAIDGLKSVHRLDRQTSGIVFFAKNEKKSNEFRQGLIDNKVRKVYYARVIGNFKNVCKSEGQEEVKEEKEEKEEKEGKGVKDGKGD